MLDNIRNAIEQLAPASLAGIWVVEEIPDSELVVVTNANRDIRDQLWGRDKARQQVEGKPCLWLNLKDGAVKEGDR